MPKSVIGFANRVFAIAFFLAMEASDISVGVAKLAETASMIAKAFSTKPLHAKY